MNTLSSKLSAVATTLLINGLVMGAVGFLFELQSHPHMSALAFARQLAAHQWFT